MQLNAQTRILKQFRSVVPIWNLQRILVGASTALTVLIFLLISLGGLVRNEGAGLSCPDWPLCYGKVVPPMNYQIFLEWFHRLIAGSVSTLLLLISGAVALKPALRKQVGRFCVLAILLLMSQVILGGLTVLGLLDPKWVSSHLVVGMAFFGTVLWLTLNLRTQPEKQTLEGTSLGLKTASVVATGVVFAQIILGGLVSSNYAGLACADFPTCNGSWIPELVGGVRLQFFHRVGALVTTVSALVFSGWALSARISNRAKRSAFLVPFLVTLQVCLGIGSVFWKLPLLMSVAHLATAAALFATLLVTLYEIRRS